MSSVQKEKFKLIEFVKESPIFSYWRTILFVILTILLAIVIIFRMDFGLFWSSLKSLSWYALLLIILLSICEQYISWERFRRFMPKSKPKQIFDYISVSVVGSTIPPKPLGEYYKFLFSLKLFKLELKTTAFLVLMDVFFEGLFITLFAFIALFVFPKANIGVEFTFVFLGIIGILYIIFTYYETRVYLIRNSFIKKIIAYFSKIKGEILTAFYKFLKQNVTSIILGCLFSIIKLLIGVFKVYLLFLFFGLNINFWVCFGIWSIAFFVGTGSGLPGGLGVFELSFVYLAESVNIPSAIALNVAIIERIFNYWIWALFAVIFLFFKKENLFKIHEYFLKGALNLLTKINAIKIHKKKRKSKR